MSRNTLDTRDLYKRQQELEDLKQAVESAQEALKEAEDASAEHSATADGTPDNQEAFDEEEERLGEAVSDAQMALDDAQAEYGTEEQEELADLDNLESEITDWRHGESMIPESEFEDYARELAEMDDLDQKASRWPYTCIDWEKAADDLKQAYTPVSYQGEDYFVRA